jgi:hypothetical protein
MHYDHLTGFIKCNKNLTAISRALPRPARVVFTVPMN